MAVFRRPCYHPHQLYSLQPAYRTKGIQFSPPEAVQGFTEALRMIVTRM